MKLGYNTNGFAHHRLEDALVILSELGYRSVAITLDHHALNPLHRDWPQHADKVVPLLGRLQMGCVIETGARFLLDPRRKHQPTLLSADRDERGRRRELIVRAMEIGARLNADAVSFWSGRALTDEREEVLIRRLADECRTLLEHAERLSQRLAFEPEPGMFIDTLERFQLLDSAIRHPLFGVTLDVGHLHCMGEVPIGERIRSCRGRLFNVHLEDMRRGVHEHLFFGDGEIDFAEVFAALREIGYAGGVHVELSRHSHDAVETARKARDFLRKYL